jgi:hypothetical protein
MSRRIAVPFVVVAVALAVTGCTVHPGAAPGGPTPGAFTTRAALPDCGAVELGQGEQTPQKYLDCLYAGMGGAGAELVVTIPTTEGDPIPTYYRALPSGGLEIWADATHDAFGSGWWHSVCPEATSIADTGDCDEQHIE